MAMSAVCRSGLLKEHLCLPRTADNFPVEQYVPQLVVERLDMRVLPGRA